jgi:hypothetical protein
MCNFLQHYSVLNESGLVQDRSSAVSIWTWKSETLVNTLNIDHVSLYYDLEMLTGLKQW